MTTLAQLSKNIAATDVALRKYRVTSVLKSLHSKGATGQLLQVFIQLQREWNKKLKNTYMIDVLLSDVEDLMS